MKLRKLLNGVLACTMALSMVSVVSAKETFVEQETVVAISDSNITITEVQKKEIWDMIEKEFALHSAFSYNVPPIVIEDCGMTIYTDGTVKQSIRIQNNQMRAYSTASGYAIDTWQTWDNGKLVPLGYVKLYGEFYYQSSPKDVIPRIGLTDVDYVSQNSGIDITFFHFEPTYENGTIGEISCKYRLSKNLINYDTESITLYCNSKGEFTKLQESEII